MILLNQNCECNDKDYKILQSDINVFTESCSTLIVSETCKEMGISLSDKQKKEIEQTIEKDVKKINKSSEIVKNYFGSKYQNEIKLKLTHIDNKQWGFAITGEDNLMGMKAKRLGYAMIYNDHFFSIQAFCMSQTSCKKIKKTNMDKNKYIYLSRNQCNLINYKQTESFFAKNNFDEIIKYLTKDEIPQRNCREYLIYLKVEY